MTFHRPPSTETLKEQGSRLASMQANQNTGAATPDRDEGRYRTVVLVGGVVSTTHAYIALGATLKEESTAVTSSM